MNKKVYLVIYAICALMLVVDCIISAINADIQNCIRDVVMLVLAVCLLGPYREEIMNGKSKE